MTIAGGFALERRRGPTQVEKFKMNERRRLSRRRFLSQTVGGLPIGLAASQTVLADESRRSRPSAPPRLNVVCIGAHPDDPESGCGGTLARYAGSGHRVTIIYLTRGEAGIPGKSHEEAAAIRTAEAEAACKMLGADARFAGQVDGATEVNGQRAQSLLTLLTAEEPDVVFTHWPIDTHPDHQAASILTLRAYLSSRRRFRLYFFEVNSGSQTLGFLPTAYVDITAVREKKRAALVAHRSQDGERIWKMHHEVMAIFRGRELGVAAAEAFAALPRDRRSGGLPGL
jgi:LmbE family N-acetylglucosaminyl deacetylase